MSCPREARPASGRLTAILALGPVLLVGCRFDADYTATSFRCETPAQCPAGFDCRAGSCQPGGGGGDAAGGGGDAAGGEDLGCPCSLWSDEPVPVWQNLSDGQPIEVAVKLRSEVAGRIVAVRFFKSDESVGPHLARVWNVDREMLAEVEFVGETASGWQDQALGAPVPIAPETTYLVSLYAEDEIYAMDPLYFQSPHDRPPLHALADGVDGSNGVFRYGEGFPDVFEFDASNYWVDVVFEND
jgi:hypothetical protein